MTYIASQPWPFPNSLMIAFTAEWESGEIVVDPATFAVVAVIMRMPVMAVGMLGYDMTKFTILAGAFTVGVGFGLQNIFNNFVSGLILLFERPQRSLGRLLRNPAPR